MNFYAHYGDKGEVLAVSPSMGEKSTEIPEELALSFVSGKLSMNDFMVVDTTSGPVVTNDMLDVDVKVTDALVQVQPLTDDASVRFSLNTTSDVIRVMVPANFKKFKLEHNTIKTFKFNVVARDYSIVYGEYVVDMEKLVANGVVEFRASNAKLTDATILTQMAFARCGIAYEKVKHRGSANLSTFSNTITTEKEIRDFSGVIINRFSDTELMVISKDAIIENPPSIIKLILTMPDDYSMVLGSVDLPGDMFDGSIAFTVPYGGVVPERFAVSSQTFTDNLVVYEGKIPHNSI